MDHCFNAVSNYDWAAEFVRDIIIASPLHLNVDYHRKRCPEYGRLTQQELHEPPWHAGPIDQLEELDGREASADPPLMVTPQECTNASNFDERPIFGQ